MPLPVRDTGGGVDYAPVEQGLHHAICVGVYDLGTHLQERWGKRIREVLLMWEFPELRMEYERDGMSSEMPRILSKRYTHSLHEKSNLRKDLETWRGRNFTDEELAGFDLYKLLGANCQIQVTHSEKNNLGKVYANVAAIVQFKGAKRQAESDLKCFSFDDERPRIPPDTPEWLIDKIKSSDEWQLFSDQLAGGRGSGPASGPPYDDIPF